MSDLEDRIRNELNELGQRRDELRVQVHLARMEAQERFERAEKDWERLEAKLALLANESRASAAEVGEAAKLLIDEIKAAYRHVRELL